MVTPRRYIMTYPPVGSKRLCECGACHLRFGSTHAFDRHRLGLQCCDPAERGLVERGGVWRTPGVAP